MQNLNYFMIKQFQTQSRHWYILQKKGSLLVTGHWCIKKLECKFYQMHLPKEVLSTSENIITLTLST